MSDFDELRKSLLESDDEFRRWSQEHRSYESRLAELAGKTELSPEEEIEEKQLKKRKLFLKDQMAARLRGEEISRTA